jgi:pimeloyl-ACP methyl ester carboxylesterase
VLAALVTALLVLTGCTPSAGGTQASSDPAATQGAPAGLEKFYTQNVQWSPCEGGKFDCTTVKVPVDYANPGGDAADLALIRLNGRNAKGNLLVNPGGPGGSGYDMVKDSVQTMFSAKLLDSYNVIGFDPRGVKRSAPVTCVSDSERDALREFTADPDTDAGLAATFAEQKKLIDACQAHSGPMLAHTDTISAAKDMDIIRAAASREVRLDYLGYSYGTFLGSTYATLFPDRVGRMVLDGALDPSLDNHEITRGQARGFEAAVHAYVRSCLTQSDCPLSGSEDAGIAKIQALLATVRQSPLHTNSGRTINVTDFVNGFILPLYNDKNWPALTQALVGAFKGDGSGMLRLADIAADREQDGTYSSNSNFAFMAYNCLDYSTDASPAAPGRHQEGVRGARARRRDAGRGGPAQAGLAHPRGVLRLRRGQLPRLALQAGAHSGARALHGPEPDPRGGHDRRPGDPVRVGREPPQAARQCGPADLEGRGPHRLRAGLDLRGQRRGLLPRGPQGAHRRHPLLTGWAALSALPAPPRAASAGPRWRARQRPLRRRAARRRSGLR